MYKKDFDKLEKFPNNCVFFGNTFFLQQYEEKILNFFHDENILKFYFEEYDFEEAKMHLTQTSLFGGVNVVIIKHNKIPPNLDKLIKYAKNSFLFFFYYGNKKPTIFGKNFVRFFEPTISDILQNINKKEKELNIEISKEAKIFLSKTLQASFIDKELEKLSIYSNKIALNDVKKLVFEYKEESFEELFNKMLDGKDFYENLLSFLETNDYKRVIPAFIRYIRDLYMYNLYIKQTGDSSLEGLLGYKLPYHINKNRVERAVKLKEKDYYSLFKFLLEKELEMRNSEKNKEALFWETVSFLKLFNSF